MPISEVYLCDKTEGLRGEHLHCGREVGENAIDVVLTVSGGEGGGKVYEPRFCGRRHANYWLIRQRVAHDA